MELCFYIDKSLHTTCQKILGTNLKTLNFQQKHKELEIGKRLIFTTMSQSCKIQSPNRAFPLLI